MASAGSGEAGTECCPQERGYHEYIEERTGAEMFPIILTEKYSSNYNECLEQAKDQRGQDEIPELTEHIDNLDDYNVIFLGYAGGIIGLN